MGTAVFSIVALVAFSVLGQASSVWTRSNDKVQAFQSARLGFEIVTRTLGQATLNTYLDYDDPARPVHYLRKSDLRIVAGLSGSGPFPGTPNTGTGIFFPTPLGYTHSADIRGLDSALNACGYYVEFGKDPAQPGFVPGNPPYRYRLMQVLVPTEESEVLVSNSNWYSDPAVLEKYSQPVASNVIAVVIRPQIDVALTEYAYDSRAGADSYPQPATANQLPPSIHVTLVAIDEKSARRLESGGSEPGAIKGMLAGKFANPSQYDQDLKTLSTSLAEAGIDYRVFASTVPIRESKWSKL